MMDSLSLYGKRWFISNRRTIRSGLVGDSLSTWDRVVADNVPHLVTILGPAGIGKSRLAREFAAAVVERGGRVLQGKSLPYGESAGYGAFGQQLQAVSTIFETDPLSVAREKLGQTVGTLFPAPRPRRCLRILRS